MKSSKGANHSRSRKIFGSRFDDNENQSLTSFAGLVTYQHLCQRLRLKERLKHCFASMKDSPIYGHHMIVGTEKVAFLNERRDALFVLKGPHSEDFKEFLNSRNFFNIVMLH